MKKVKVGKSRVHGKGVFADENIRKGDPIQLIRGPIVRKQTHNARESSVIEDWVGAGKDLWIKPREPFLFLNHSCDPNTVIRGKRLLVALRNIRRGQEITMDYSLTDSDLHWVMNCKCGARNCRKVIRPIQELPARTYKKYLPNIPRYFQKVYAHAHPQLRH